MGKKSRAERRKAQLKHEQRTDAQLTRSDKSIRSEVQMAASFLTSTECCPKAVKKETGGLQLGQILNIANGQQIAKPHQADVIQKSAEVLGWKPSAQTNG